MAGQDRSSSQAVEASPDVDAENAFRTAETSCGSDTHAGKHSPSPPEHNLSDFCFLEPPLEPGDLGYLGHYRVVRLLGEGGMGMVFLAEDPRLRRSVALKVMRPELAENGMARERFLREARATAKIHSDHIVAIHEISQANDIPYIVTELLHGKPLDSWLKENSRPRPAQVMDLGLQIARGLEACHSSGVIHRDIKPENIWVEEPSHRIKLLDFGVARGKDVALTEAGAVVGTPAYMSPEQAQGRPIDERCDLYSLGCVLYEAATGTPHFSDSNTAPLKNEQVPTDRKPIRDLDTAFPPEFSNLLTRLLAKDPKDRPASASEVVAALEKIAGRIDSTQTLLDAAASVPAARAKRRLPIAVGVAGVVALTIVFVLVIVLRQGRSEAALSASAGEVGVAHATGDNEIVLGMSLSLSGPAAELGRTMEIGIRAYFNNLNDAGGISGRRVQLVALDDGDEQERALANMKEFHERNALAVIGTLAAPRGEKLVAYAAENHLVYFNASTAAAIHEEEPTNRYVFGYRPTCMEETAALVKHLVAKNAIRAEQIAVFAAPGGYGDSGFDGVAKVLRKYGRRPEEILRVGHAPNIADAVGEIRSHKEIRAVVIVATYKPAAEFIRQLKESRTDLLFANVSSVGSDALAREFSKRDPRIADRVIVLQVAPPPTSPLSSVVKYRQTLRKHYPDEQPSFASLEGYINAALLAEGMRRAGDTLTSETLVNSLETLNSVDLGLGASLHYSPTEHRALHRFWGTVLDHAGQYHLLDLEQ
jgi:ABC-type branched-subunit amino acid transport system substrate-binding protein